MGARGKGFMSLTLALKSLAFADLKFPLQDGYFTHFKMGIRWQLYSILFTYVNYQCINWALHFSFLRFLQTEPLCLQWNNVWLYINAAWALWEYNTEPEAESKYFYIHTHVNAHTQTCIHKIHPFYPVYILSLYIQADYILMFMHIHLYKVKVCTDRSFRLLNAQVRVQLRLSSTNPTFIHLRMEWRTQDRHFQKMVPFMLVVAGMTCPANAFTTLPWIYESCGN